jgi:hypothetical protein
VQHKRPRRRLNDPALEFILRKIREEGLDKGLDAYCREHGILTPQRIDAINSVEHPFSGLTYREQREVHEKTGIVTQEDGE